VKDISVIERAWSNRVHEFPDYGKREHINYGLSCWCKPEIERVYDQDDNLISFTLVHHVIQ
jgi:hypothetical protein